MVSGAPSLLAETGAEYIPTNAVTTKVIPIAKANPLRIIWLLSFILYLL
jgi:hypothetical protein